MVSASLWFFFWIWSSGVESIMTNSKTLICFVEPQFAKRSLFSELLRVLPPLSSWLRNSSFCNSKVYLTKFVLSKCTVSPLIKPFLTLRWVTSAYIGKFPSLKIGEWLFYSSTRSSAKQQPLHHDRCQRCSSFVVDASVMFSYVVLFERVALSWKES